MLPARMRTAAGWSDACILDVSSRGLMVHAHIFALDDRVVELWHGDHAITARVVWRNGPKAGLRAEERIPVEDILGLSVPDSLQLAVGRPPSAERRKGPRTHDDNRLAARAFEFASVAIIASTLAFGFSMWVEEALAQPLALVETALGGHASSSSSTLTR